MATIDSMKKIFDSANVQYEEYEDSEGNQNLAVVEESDGDVIEFVFDSDGEFMFIRKEL